jgi:hypothetical protein
MSRSGTSHVTRENGEDGGRWACCVQQVAGKKGEIS